jgi:hypothetical protein
MGNGNQVFWGIAAATEARPRLRVKFWASDHVISSMIKTSLASEGFGFLKIGIDRCDSHLADQYSTIILNGLFHNGAFV